MGEPWWHTFFDETYATVGLVDTDPQRASRRTDFLLETLALEPGDLLFDQCCGTGRVSLPLAERGVAVIGVDRVSGYVEQARRAAAAAKLPAEFHCADAFTYTTPRPCRAAVNWFTSFGYDDDDEVNVRMFQRAFESLAPGGRYGLDYINVPWICAQFRSRHYHYGSAEDPDGLLVLEEVEADCGAGMFRSQWTFVHPDGRRERRRVATRMYMPHEIVSLLRRCGFAGVELYGSIDGEPLELRSRRCIVVAGKRP